MILHARSHAGGLFNKIDNYGNWKLNIDLQTSSDNVLYKATSAFLWNKDMSRVYGEQPVSSGTYKTIKVEQSDYLRIGEQA